MRSIHSNRRGSIRSRVALPQINVTPMIDVLLVLLIIFMIIAPTRPARFETKVPEKPVGNVDSLPSAILMVTMGAGEGFNQTVDLNSHSMALPELAGVLKPILAERPDRTVFIKGSKKKRYRDVLAVIDALKEAGAAPIGLQVDYLQ
ncbi:MAG TPA: biopolymer transporter ExbD [Blastocatellia bacterium]|nr:biopolymer transporter ExbD [Blastocatellia bacterium]